MDPKYGPAIIHRDAFFKVLDVYGLRGHAQITLLHIPEELIDHLQHPRAKRDEREMVEAARTNFEESLAKPAVPALTEAEWLERVAFPLGMSEEGDLFYGGSPEDPKLKPPALLTFGSSGGGEEAVKGVPSHVIQIGVLTTVQARLLPEHR